MKVIKILLKRMKILVELVLYPVKFAGGRASDRMRQKMGNSAAFSREIMWQIMRVF